MSKPKTRAEARAKIARTFKGRKPNTEAEMRHKLPPLKVLVKYFTRAYAGYLQDDHGMTKRDAMAEAKRQSKEIFKL